MFIRIHCALLLSLFLFAGSGPVNAQEKKAELSWEQLLKVREDSFTRLKELQAEAQKATPAQREELVKEYTQIATRLQNEIFPGLGQQVAGELEKNPKDETTLEVANELMQFSFSRNDYPTTKAVAEAVLKADAQNDVAANFAGVANFAEHNFEDAHRILSLAKKKGQLLGDLGGQYLGTSETYIDYWAKEQAIREKEAAATGDDQLPRVKFETSRGDIVLELFENEAPNTVANFVNLVEKGFYDGLLFHRVIPNFMAQGGCPLSKTNPQRAGSGGPGYNIECEAYQPNARRHFSGTLSMAHAGKDTGGSQFFITHLPTPHLDREISPSSVHTVFGRVVEGLDVVRSLQKDDVIEKATVIRKRKHEYKPKTIPE